MAPFSARSSMPEKTSRTTFTVLSRTGPVRRPLSAISPTQGDLELMRIVAIMQYLAGGLTLIIAAAVLPDLDTSDNKAYFGLGALALVLALVRFFQRGAMTLAHARFSNLAGLAFIATIVAVSRPIGATPAFYLWPVLTAAYFLRRRDLFVVFVLFMISFAVALWGFTENEAEAQIYVPMVLVVFVVTGLVRLMRESLAGMIGDLELTASTDDLTGLVNRATFRGACYRDLERARRNGSPFSLVVVDLDHFKAVNDRLGHAAGDIALKRFASLLTAECRGGDLPARYGGEEFVVALQDTSPEEAFRFGERLRARVEAATADDAAPLTVSVGVVTHTTDITTPEALIECADAALYVAKNAGRNRVVRFDHLPGKGPETVATDLDPGPAEASIPADPAAAPE
jgi:diguanylate cyclase (GGDEF)-like protein